MARPHVVVHVAVTLVLWTGRINNIAAVSSAIPGVLFIAFIVRLLSASL